MKRIKKNYKAGIAMIELIFSLVIIAIVLLSAPMLIHQGVQSNSVALQQEAIAAVASQTSILLSKDWDQNDTNRSFPFSPILTTNSASFTIDTAAADLKDRTRAGLTDIIGRGVIVTVNGVQTTLSASNIGSEGGDDNDIDDYHGSSLGLQLYNAEVTTASVGDYVDKNITMNTTVQYIDDTPNTLAPTSIANNFATELPISQTSNIKFVTVTLTTNNPALMTNSELNKSITLQAFSCNIGSYAPVGVEK